MLYGIRHVYDELGLPVVGLKEVPPALMSFEVVDEQNQRKLNVGLVDPIQNRNSEQDADDVEVDLARRDPSVVKELMY